VFVAATNKQEIIWSEDGETWFPADTLSEMNTGANYVFFGNNEFILATRDVTSGETAKWAKSTDGKAWTAVAGPTGGSGRNEGRAAGGGAYGNGAWVIGSSSGNIFVPAAATTETSSPSWTAKATNIQGINWVNGAAFGNGVFVITGMGGKIAWSSDTATWTWNDVSPKEQEETEETEENEEIEAANLFSGTVNSVVFGNGRFMAVGGKPNIAVTSTDGKNWTQTGGINIDGTDDYIHVGYGADVFIAGREKDGLASYTTNDGKSWMSITDTKLTGITGIAYGAGKYVMVGATSAGPAIAYSIPE
jgi:hypothetical protein